MPKILQASEDDLKSRFFALQQPEEVADLLELSGYPFLANLLYGLTKEEKYIRFETPKRNGNMRVIHNPIPRLKDVQRRLLEVLEVMYKPKAPVHGFVPGKSIKSNAEGHQRRKYVLNVDLKDFFPSINYWRVRGMFKADPYKFNDSIADVLAQICTLPAGLPQGAPTSPIISNMICAKLDYQLQKLAKQHHCYYTRYADDISFSTSFFQFPTALAEINLVPEMKIIQYELDGNNLVEEIFVVPEKTEVILGQELIDTFKSNGFRVNKDKIRLQTANHRQEVTGLVVNKKVNVKRQYISQIRAMLHAWGKYGYEAAEAEYHEKYWRKKPIKPNQNPPSFLRTLKGKIEFLGMVRGKEDIVYIKINNQAEFLERSETHVESRLFKPLNDPTKESVTQLIKLGERENIEFKMGACLDKQGKRNPGMFDQIFQTVVAMMNEVPSGNVLIGVEDDGTVCGIEREFEVANNNKQNWDGYYQFLDNSLRDRLRNNKAYTPNCYKIENHSVGDHIVAIIRTKRREKITFDGKDLFVRKGSKSEKLDPSEIESYITNRKMEDGKKKDNIEKNGPV
jgi:RNA-directed DNA polymerase